MGIIILMRMMYLDAELFTSERGTFEPKVMLRFSSYHPSRAVAWYKSRLGSDVTLKRVRVGRRRPPARDPDHRRGE